MFRIFLMFTTLVFILSCLPLQAQVKQEATRSGTTQKLANGFYDHGVATPISNHRGTVATVDGNGRNVVLVWLFDHRGGYAILMIDAETGKSEEFPAPFPPGGDCPYASILSSKNKYYTHFNGHFSEFDPVKRAFTFFEKTSPQMAMSMTEDDTGRIWSATYPNSGLVSFDPNSRTFKDYAHLYDQNWRQYPRSMAADDAGWVYFGVGSTLGQIVAVDSDSGKAMPMIPEDKRMQGSAHVYRDLDGKVYGQPVSGIDGNWIAFYKGKANPVGALTQKREKPYIAGSQGLFHRSFPDGKQIVSCDLVDRELVVKDPKTGAETIVSFDYTSEGAHLMGVAVAPDLSICGGTAFPMRFFSYSPATDSWVNLASYGQWNTVARQADRFFVGAYSGGFLLEWNPAKPWVPTEKGDPNSNPRFLTVCKPDINRPHALLAHPNGRVVVMAGTPGYGYTGGGLLFWDRETGQHTLVAHTKLLPQHSTQSLLALSDDLILGGSTTAPGTGGEQKAKEAELYILDLNTKQMVWHAPVIPGAQGYTDLCSAPNGLVYGFADRKIFFVFDPQEHKLVHQQNTEPSFGLSTSQQGPRVFVTAEDGTVYILFAQSIAIVDASSWKLSLVAQSPVPIQAGGDMLGNRIFFASGSHLYSYQLGK